MKKINLKQFESEQLSILERINVKAGSGSVSKRTYTRTAGIDSDRRQYDPD